MHLDRLTAGVLGVLMTATAIAPLPAGAGTTLHMPHIESLEDLEAMVRTGQLAAADAAETTAPVTETTVSTTTATTSATSTTAVTTSTTAEATTSATEGTTEETTSAAEETTEETETTSAYPSRYDMREVGVLPAVRDQGSYGMCWSFSAMASLESAMTARDPAVDLSEWALAYHCYSPRFGFPLPEGASQTDALRHGGNFYIAAPLLTSWVGPATEAAYPFGDYSVLDPNVEADAVREQAAVHVTDAELLRYRIGGTDVASSTDEIKKAVTEGHAVSVSFLRNLACFDSKNDSFYNDGTSEAGTNHAVAIVGWDDSFPASSFLTDPGTDGAWLCRNSYGTGRDDFGYFWMSYADKTIYEIYYLDSEPVGDHSRQYRYDDYGYWTSVSVEEAEGYAYMANVFVAEEECWLTSAMFCTALPGERYTIRVYTDLDHDVNGPVSGTASVATYGRMENAGYHTVDLVAPVHLTMGQTFSIVVQLAGTNGQHIPCEASSRYMTEKADGTVTVQESALTAEMIEATLEEGQSWFSTDGKRWHDIYREPAVDETYTIADGVTVHAYARLGNVCVRGLTKSVGLVTFSEAPGAVPAGTQITLATPGNTPIQYQIDGGTPQSYSAPITVTKDMTVAAWTFVNGIQTPLVRRSYRVRRAALTCLLDTDTGEYISFTKTGSRCTAVLDDPAETLHLLPIVQGTVTVGDTVWHSGETMTLSTEGVRAITLDVAGEETEGRTYVLYLGELPGDVDLDGNVDARDASEILVYSTELAVGHITEANAPDAAWMSRADFDGDGRIDARDASEILIYSVESAVGR